VAKQKRATTVKELNERVLAMSISQHPLYLDDDTLETFDNAVCAAEEELQSLLPKMSPAEIVARFAKHLSIHMETELEGAKKYGNDVEAFRSAVNEGTESAF
jgi:hypothetical protein